jgi:hypothetical protein
VIGGWERARPLVFAALASAAIGIAAAQPAPPLQPAGDDPVSARAFEVRYRPLDDAAELVSAVLSDEGEFTLRPRLLTLVVTDRQSVLSRVAALLESWDVPPRNANFTFNLILGRRPTDEQGGGTRPPLSDEVRNVMEMLRDVTQWSDYSSLGSYAVTSSEGERVVANLTEEYRVVFVLESVHEGQGRIKLERLALQRLRDAPEGGRRYDDLYSAGMVLVAGRVTLVGAAKDPDSSSALFLAVQATPR